MRILSLPFATDFSGRKFIKVEGRYYRRSHLVVWEHTGLPVPPWTVVDHIDGDVSNDNPENLRMVTQAVNMKNLAKNRNNTSGHMGVHSHRNGRFYARIKVNGVVISLGGFATFQEAVEARELAEIEHNFHPNHGKR